MDLILVRHGEAEHAGPAQTDAERRLTRSGRTAVARTARTLMDHGLTSPRILTSPKVRALETARIIAETMGADAPTIVEALRGDHEISRILAALANVEGERIIAVGHMPDLGGLAARLLDPAESGSVAMRTAGYVWLELDALPPRVTPRLVRFD